MSLGSGDPASETGDDSLSAITFDSDTETKTRKKSFHKPPPTSPKSPYCSKPRKVASWRSLRTAASMPLGHRMSLTPQKLWLGSSKQGRVLGTPVYKEKEDMYDEIIELKKFRPHHTFRGSVAWGHTPGIAASLVARPAIIVWWHSLLW